MIPSARSRARGARALVLMFAALTSGGCGGCGERRPEASKPAATVSAAPPTQTPPAQTLVDLIRALPGCDVDHRGPLLDAGTEALIGRYGWSERAPEGVASVEHDGSTWSRTSDRKVHLSFSLLERTPIFVAARVVGHGARAAAVSLDDQPLGTLSFAREQIRIASTGTTQLPVDPGLHTLTLRFSGSARDGNAFADLDWVRVGVPDESAATYGPPTLRDLVSHAAALSGVPHRALALRAPGSVRCALRLPREARLRTAVGMQGTGEGEAEVRVLRDGKPPELLRTVHGEGGDKATWTDLDLPLAVAGDEVVSLELRATLSPQGGRVLFGDPMVVLPGAAPQPTPPSRLVIVVVLDGVERGELPPWSGAPAPMLGALSELAATSTVFDAHRAPSTVVAATVASLLTGLPPSAHGVADGGARLSAAQTTIAAVARDASVRTAMFTGVPPTFRAFGFGSGWERFVEHAPSSGDPATAPLDSAAAWVTEVTRASSEAKMLAVVHARGGHPPWDVTPKEIGAAAPPDYTGMIEPRRGGQLLGRMRKSRRVSSVVTDADRRRVRALEQLALAGQDRALGALIAALKAANLWETTLLVVTGDVGSGATDLFADGGDLREPVLSLPLYVHFPGGLYGGRRVAEPTEITDITRTSLRALDLSFSRPPRGKDLAWVAGGFAEPPDGPQIATLPGRYSARWRSLVLTGRFPSAPSLCDLALDPLCTFNRRETMPIASSAIFRSIVAEDAATRAPREAREPATIDAETAAALSVWGATD
jgi:Sulfatase